MANDASNINVPSAGQAYLGDVGVTLPALHDDPTAALDGGLADLGYWTTDGATLTRAPTIKEFEAFQAQAAVRSSVIKVDWSIAIQFEEWNKETVEKALGGTITESGGFFGFTPQGAGDATPEFSAVVNIQDGEKNHQYVIPRCTTSTENVTAQFQRGEMALLPITLKALEPDSGPSLYVNFDDDAFAVGS